MPNDGPASVAGPPKELYALLDEPGRMRDVVDINTGQADFGRIPGVADDQELAGTAGKTQAHPITQSSSPGSRRWKNPLTGRMMPRSFTAPGCRMPDSTAATWSVRTTRMRIFAAPPSGARISAARSFIGRRLIQTSCPGRAAF